MAAQMIQSHRTLVGFVTLTLLFAGCTHQKSAAADNPSLEPPPAPREFRGVWVATVGNIDWPTKPGLSTADQQKEAIAILDKCVELNLNAVVFQVRPACDAMYASKIEPWSYFLTGKQGQAPNPYYDPLKFWVDESHKRGLELHAWFNPYRAHLTAEKTDFAPNHVSKTHPEIVKKYGEYLWLDPADKASQDQTYNVVMDIAKRYDVDGMHIDDYFYPYKIKKFPKDKNSKEILDFPDDDSWKRYKRSGGKLDYTDIYAEYYATTKPDDRKPRDREQIARENWRRQNVNQLIHRIYEGLKHERKDVKFGIAPFGLQRKGLRPQIAKGFDPYEELYADADMWFQKGWCDYFAPQLYWKTTAATQPYQPLLQRWVEENQSKRNLYAGNFTGRVGEIPEEDETTQPATSPSERSERERRRRARIWPVQEILDQIRITRETPGASGNIHFSMKVFQRDPDQLNEKLLKGPYREQALVPASSWLDNKPPGMPEVTAKSQNDGIVVSWKAGSGLFGSEKPWQWTVYTKRGDAWDFHVYPWQTMTAKVPAGATAVAVAAVDRNGNESKRMVVTLK
jgi:uncharacterized lipoprotein YddW (UPF0748 family)